MGRPGWWRDGWLVAIVVGGAALRLVGLGSQSLWYDEVVTPDVVRSPLGGLLGAVARREGSPPLSYAIGWAWARVAGTGDVALRVPAFVAGVALVPAVAALAVELGLPRRAVRAAALLAAAHPMLVWYSQEARAYSLFALTATIAGVLALRARRLGTTASAWWWAAAAAACVTTHFFAALVVVPQAIALRSRWRPVAVVAAVQLALVPLALRQRSTGQQAWIDDWSLGFRVTDGLQHLVAGPAPFDGRLWVAVAALGTIALGLARRVPGPLVVAVATLLALPIGAGLVGFDYFLDRNVLVAVVPAVVAIGAAATTRPGAVVVGAAAVLLAAGSLAASTHPSLQKADWAAVADAVDTTPDGRLVVVSIDRVLGLPLTRYLPGATPLGPDGAAVTEIDVLSLAPPTSFERAPCTWWFGRSCVFIFLGGPLPDGLSARFEPVDERVAGQFRITRYRASSPVVVTVADLAPLVGPDSFVAYQPAR